MSKQQIIALVLFMSTLIILAFMKTIIIQSSALIGQLIIIALFIVPLLGVYFSFKGERTFPSFIIMLLNFLAACTFSVFALFTYFFNK